ncbi:hypothetical protein AQUCO_00500149v1 [Aquilegia coerulea]|uniref:Transcription repressor n=1 Tax=Aquilegia coerulea TaxID=218851 RepID=A0A2G5EQK0_AQUCA|nr:hypothetical protein AQUCO_00500149v1 [Aquilegia coerulea]
MGNYKFKLSDMMPNAWFYKLKDMGKPRNNHNHNTSSSSSQSLNQIKKKNLSSSTPPTSQPQFINHRQSYYFTTEPLSKPDKLYNSPINPKSSDVHFLEPPRKSSKRKSTRRRRSIKSSSSSSTKIVTSSVSAGCSCRATLDSVWIKTETDSTYSASPPDSSPDVSALPEFGSEHDAYGSWSSSCSCRLSSSTTDIIIDVDNNKSSSHSIHKFENLDGFDSLSQLDLPPILTKPAKFNDMVTEIKKRETEPVKYRKGLKLRSNSPRIASKKLQAYSRKSISSTTNIKARRKNLSDSFAIVKSSFDPQRDFRESMVEMIVENNIRASKDLEELLACYLSLNSNEYHDIIVKVFEQIWFDLTDIQL